MARPNGVTVWRGGARRRQRGGPLQRLPDPRNSSGSDALSFYVIYRHKHNIRKERSCMGVMAELPSSSTAGS
eukprot:6213889-Pleurochrysis_carterae.AAC.1